MARSETENLKGEQVMARSEPERREEGVPRTENTDGICLLSPCVQGPLGVN